MAYIGKSPDGTGVRSRFYYTQSSGGGTTVSGSSDDGTTLAFSDGAYVDVFLNGVLLVAGTDYNTSTANTIAGLAALANGDVVEVVVYDIFTVADTVSSLNGGTFTAPVGITTADNNPQLTLKSTDADASSGPILHLTRDSASPADDDVIGQIKYIGKNDAAEDVVYGKVDVVLKDASDGTEDAEMRFLVATAGDNPNALKLGSTEIVFNDSSHDVDFRVESDNSANAFFVQGSDGNVGIGTNSPSDKLHVDGDIRVNNAIESAGNLNVEAENGVFRVYTGTGSPSERIRVLSSGELLVGKTATDTSSEGAVFGPAQLQSFTRNGNKVLRIRRNTDDGTLMEFFQDGTQEGKIQVTGSTVQYVGGTLARFSQATDGNRIDGLVKGTVMTNLDQMAVWTKDGVTEENEQLNCMAVSSVEGDANVAGVFVNWDDEDEDYTADMHVAMTGDFVIRIAQGTTVARGDLLMSAGDGTAKPQNDDIVRSKTIAKVTSTTVSHTYDDGTFLVPCVLMAC